jgi:hypothetical protein
MDGGFQPYALDRADFGGGLGVERSFSVEPAGSNLMSVSFNAAPESMTAMDSGSGAQLTSYKGGSAGVLTDSASAFAGVTAVANGGTDVPTFQAANFSAEIAMPSAEMLLAAMATANDVGGEGGIVGRMIGDAHAELGNVLADALAGGGGVDIDSLLAALPGDGPGGGTSDMLASHGAVPAWDMGGFGGFTAQFAAHNIEAMTLHQDAVQAA